MNDIFQGDVLNRYNDWETPTLILSDGAYGVNGFPGDPRTPDGLGEWYRPHIEKWSEAATAHTSLWFWNTEIGWANTHPVLVQNGWKYVETVIWDKGINHIAGNVNGNTIRRFPVVTEISVLYVRPVEIQMIDGKQKTVQDWLRDEWFRSGLKLNDANVACGVKNAASRKYFAKDHEWYMPPAEMFMKLKSYANLYGNPEGAPYFVTEEELTLEAWEKKRSVWNHTHGLTNVWSYPPLKGAERLKVNGKPFHGNQKPITLMERQIKATTNEGDMIWEPFGGLGSASVAAKNLGRQFSVAEQNKDYYAALVNRLI